MNQIGIHIRLTNTIIDVVEKAIRLNLPTFQTFAVSDKGQVIKLDKKSVKEYLELRRKHFKNLYLHSSYWVNLARKNKRSYKTFLRELELARELEFTHIILHPGAANTKSDREDGIQILADNLNQILDTNNKIKILLENTAHGGRSVGSDLEDFKILLTKVKQPEKIEFCIDTSHAYAYGYDIATPEGQESFIDLLDSTISLSKIHLIHLNDTSEPLGAKIDKHLSPGEGRIGTEALKSFVKHPKLQNVTAIMELPKLDETDEIKVIEEVLSW